MHNVLGGVHLLGIAPDSAAAPPVAVESAASMLPLEGAPAALQELLQPLRDPQAC